MENLEQFLKGLPLLSSFSPEELKQLIEASQLRSFAPREVIIHFGQPGKFLGIVVEGEAEAVVSGEAGARRLGLLKRGDVLGEMSLLTGEPTSADVIALTKCQLFLIPHETFSNLLAVNPGAVKVLAKTLSERLRSRQQDEQAKTRVDDAWRSLQDPYGIGLSTATPSKILVMNAGSSSLKFGYFDTVHESCNLDGIVDRIGFENSRIICTSRSGKAIRELGHIDYASAFNAVIALITDSGSGVIHNPNELTAVGHRVVHGADKYKGATVINQDVIDDIEKYSSLAPLHNPINLLVIKESVKLMPKVPQVAVFDTGFHQRMPVHAYLYGLPYELYEKERIRRYGFHGISHNYVSLQAAAYLKRDFREMKIVSCHLGNGASLCAVDHGWSVDTSMGMTPLEGLIMGTRCGDIDPSIITHLIKEKGMSIEAIDEILNYKSGLKGISGISSDLRTLEEAANKGDSRAILAIQVFGYRIRKYIGSYVAALGGLDTLIFTGGIGEGSAWVRSLSCQGLSCMGIHIDDVLNRTASTADGKVADISDANSQVKVLVVPTDEERMIARDTIRALGYQNTANIIRSQQAKQIPVEVSAHHVHLARADVETIFGAGHELTRRSDLSQPGQFACEESVNLVGPKGGVERVRILGPYRKQSQVEISRTEEFRLGIKAPIRASGDLQGSPGIALEGPKGKSNIANGVICALRHIHMTPADALSFGLRDRDVVMVRIEGERTLIFGDVLVRVDPDFRLAMHIDTDEANAANIRTGMIGFLVGVQDRR